MSTIMLLAIVMPMVGAFVGVAVALFRFGRSFGAMVQSVKDIKDRVARIETKIDNNAEARQTGG